MVSELVEKSFFSLSGSLSAGGLHQIEVKKRLRSALASPLPTIDYLIRRCFLYVLR